MHIRIWFLSEKQGSFEGERFRKGIYGRIDIKYLFPEEMSNM